jgi:hypothetical protein
MFLRPSMVVIERSETVLAQIVLAAQERAEAEVERDEDSLPCLVWNDIREAARVRALPGINACGRPFPQVPIALVSQTWR